VNDLFSDVGVFHHKFDLDRFGQTISTGERTETGFPRSALIEPNLLSQTDFMFRLDFMREEICEFADAHEAGDLPKMADALVDLVYVALGTAHLMHLPFDDVWREVQRANMAKERATDADDPRSVRKNALDVVKPEGWKPPDVEGVLRRWGWQP
jgi:predicted HAD superfamily Cof-like phosphohydrolase